MEELLDKILLGLVIIREKHPNYHDASIGVTIDHVCKSMDIDLSFSNLLKAKLLDDGFIKYIRKDYDRLVQISDAGYIFLADGGYTRSKAKIEAEKLNATPLPKKRGGQRRSSPAFKDLFFSKEDLEKFLKAMPNEIINEKGVFIGWGDRPTEILALIEALKQKNYLKKYSQAAICSAFCSFFKINISARSYNSLSKTNNDLVADYIRLIPDRS